MSWPVRVKASCDGCGRLLWYFDTPVEATDPNDLVLLHNLPLEPLYCAWCERAKGEESVMIGDAIKMEILALLGGETCDAKTLARIERVARAGRQLLVATATGDMALPKRLGELSDDYGEEAQYNSPIAFSPPNETFGSKAIREITAVLPALVQAQRPPLNPAALMEAINMAEASGKKDIARLLEAKLKEFATPAGAVPYNAVDVEPAVEEGNHAEAQP